MQMTIGPFCLCVHSLGCWVRCRWWQWAGWNLTWERSPFSVRFGLRKPVLQLGRLRLMKLDPEH